MSTFTGPVHIIRPTGRFYEVPVNYSTTANIVISKEIAVCYRGATTVYRAGPTLASPKYEIHRLMRQVLLLLEEASGYEHLYQIRASSSENSTGIFNSQLYLSLNTFGMLPWMSSPTCPETKRDIAEANSLGDAISGNGHLNGFDFRNLFHRNSSVIFSRLRTQIC